VWVGPTYFSEVNPVVGRHTTAAPLTFGGLISGYGFVASNATQTITITNNVNTFTGGVIVVQGTVQIDGSLPLLCPVTNDVNGTLAGVGTFNSVVTNAGTISPGSSVGTITFATNLVMLNNSIINWELGASTNDMISVLGNLTLDSNTTLRVLNGGFLSNPNGTFVVMSYSGTDPVLGTWTVDTSSSPWSGATTSVALDTITKRILLTLVARSSSSSSWSLYRQNSSFRKNSAIKSQGGN